MKCPDCLHQIYHGAPECPLCGSTLERISPLYGNITRKVDRIHDVAGILNTDQRNALAKKVSACARSFPEINIAFSIISLRNQQTIESYCFWLLGAGEFAGEDNTQRRPDARVLITYDVRSKTACSIFGDSFHGHISQNESFDLLAVGHPYLIEGNYVEAIKATLTSLKKQLILSARRANKKKT